MKNLLKIITIFILTFLLFGILNVNASAIDLGGIQGVNKIIDHSNDDVPNTGNISDDVKSLGFSILTTIKYIVSGLLVILLVYIGIEMILSMGSNEEKLSSAKKQLRYTLIGLVFINIPGSLYEIFEKTGGGSSISGGINGTWTNNGTTSILINNVAFNTTIIGGVVLFVEIVISAIAIIIIIISGIRIMTSRGREDQITEGKDKIVWSLVGLVFIGFIEGWKRVVYSGSVTGGANLFKTGVELTLFFAGPIAIFFLTLAGYYFITANGDDERIKKAKSIIINTVIATVILLASYAFLKDLITL